MVVMVGGFLGAWRAYEDMLAARMCDVFSCECYYENGLSTETTKGFCSTWKC